MRDACFTKSRASTHRFPEVIPQQTNQHHSRCDVGGLSIVEVRSASFPRGQSVHIPRVRLCVRAHEQSAECQWDL